MVFVPVDNYSGGKEEIDRLQKFMKQVFEDFHSLELPSSWHIFHLVLRDRFGKTGARKPPRSHGAREPSGSCGANSEPAKSQGANQ